MSASDGYLNYLGGADWQDAVEIIWGELGKGASRHVAEALGVSMRQAQRIASGAGVGHGRQTASGRKHEAKLRGMAAALRVRGAQRIHAGRARLRYEDKDQGARNIGTLPITGPLGDAMGEVAGLLEQGNFAAAAEMFDQAVLSEYGIETTELAITDYEDGLDMS